MPDPGGGLVGSASPGGAVDSAGQEGNQAAVKWGGLGGRTQAGRQTATGVEMQSTEVECETLQRTLMSDFRINRPAAAVKSSETVAPCQIPTRIEVEVSRLFHVRRVARGRRSCDNG